MRMDWLALRSAWRRNVWSSMKVMKSLKPKDLMQTAGELKKKRKTGMQKTASTLT